MSRIGKKPIPVLDGVTVKVDGQTVAAEGPKGSLKIECRPEVSVRLDEEAKLVIVDASEDRQSKSLHGLTRSLINNMIVGVKDGYERRLEIVGVGYQANLSGDQLKLRVGFANEITKIVPAGLDVTCPDNTHVVVQGPDKQQVGQFAAEVRAVRKPEPYKGKGIRYQGEHVKIKPGKAAT